jgi:hypothetical protein
MNRRARQVLRQGYNPYGERDYTSFATPLEERRQTAQRALRFFARKGGTARSVRQQARQALGVRGWTPSQIDEALGRSHRRSLRRAAHHGRSR